MDLAPWPVQPTDRARVARRSVLLTAGTVALFLLYVTSIHLLLPPQFDLFGPVLEYFTGWRSVSSMDLPGLSAVLTFLLLANLVLAVTAKRWCRCRHAATVYVVVHAVGLTVALHYVASAPLGLFLVYGFVVVHPAVIRSPAASFATANLCAGLYALLALYEQRLLEPRLAELPLVLQQPVRTQKIVYVSLAFLALNCLAAFAASYGKRLRGFAAALRTLVEERTAELQAANERLADANVELEAFVYAVTHDVKTPIASMGLLLGMILERDRHALSDETRGEIERIAHLETSAERLILDLLGFFRATAHEEARTWVDLGAVVEHSLERLRPALVQKRIRVDVQGSLPRVWAQQAQMEHVVGNLLGNAVKYTPAGGGPITIGGEADGGWARFFVADQGIGIPSRYHERIFDLFGRVPPDHRAVNGHEVEGTGVGLAIVKRIVARYGGRVSVQSQPGHGSRFDVLLPRPREERGTNP